MPIWIIGNLICKVLLGHEMDVRDLKFDDSSFDVAIDKGTMDAMMTAKGDIWVCQLLRILVAN